MRMRRPRAGRLPRARLSRVRRPLLPDLRDPPRVGDLLPPLRQPPARDDHDPRGQPVRPLLRRREPPAVGAPRHQSQRLGTAQPKPAGASPGGFVRSGTAPNTRGATAPAPKPTSERSASAAPRYAGSTASVRAVESTGAAAGA